MLENDKINNGSDGEQTMDPMAPRGLKRLSGLFRTAVKGVLPGFQMTKQELQEEFDSFYANGGKTAYERMSVDELPPR